MTFGSIDRSGWGVPSFAPASVKKIPHPSSTQKAEAEGGAWAPRSTTHTPETKKQVKKARQKAKKNNELVAEGWGSAGSEAKGWGTEPEEPGRGAVFEGSGWDPGWGSEAKGWELEATGWGSEAKGWGLEATGWGSEAKESEAKESGTKGWREKEWRRSKHNTPFEGADHDSREGHSTSRSVTYADGFSPPIAKIDSSLVEILADTPTRDRTTPEQVLAIPQQGTTNVDLATAGQHVVTSTESSHSAVGAATPQPMPVRLPPTNPRNHNSFGDTQTTMSTKDSLNAAAVHHSLLVIAEQDKHQLSVGVEDLFRLRDLDVGEAYLQLLPPDHRWRLVVRLVTAAVWSDNGVADARLVSSLFLRAVSNRVVSHEEFVIGFLPVLDTLDIIVPRASNALVLIAIMLRGAKLDEAHLRGLVCKAIGSDAELLLALLLPLDEVPPSAPVPPMSRSDASAHSAKQAKRAEPKVGGHPSSDVQCAPHLTAVKPSLGDVSGGASEIIESPGPHNSIQPIAQPATSAVARARPIRDMNQVLYPEGIKPPQAELNVGAQRGKYNRYDIYRPVAKNSKD